MDEEEVAWEAEEEDEEETEKEEREDMKESRDWVPSWTLTRPPIYQPRENKAKRNGNKAIMEKKNKMII